MNKMSVCCLWYTRTYSHINNQQKQNKYVCFKPTVSGLNIEKYSWTQFNICGFKRPFDKLIKDQFFF